MRGDILNVVGHHDGGEDREPVVDVETAVVVVGVHASDLDLVTRAGTCRIFSCTSDKFELIAAAPSISLRMDIHAIRESSTPDHGTQYGRLMDWIVNRGASSKHGKQYGRLMDWIVN